jgi:hypothetical protein
VREEGGGGDTGSRDSGDLSLRRRAINRGDFGDLTQVRALLHESGVLLYTRTHARTLLHTHTHTFTHTCTHTLTHTYIHTHTHTHTHTLTHTYIHTHTQE